MSDHCLRDYICGIVPMGKKAWYGGKKLDMLQCYLGIVFMWWCRMCVIHLLSTIDDKGMYTGERKDYTRPCDDEHTR